MKENELLKASLSRAMALCASREYCSADIILKLQSWGLTGDQSHTITEKLRKDNFINDERYALAFARDKFRYNKWGKVKIASHLRMKNISTRIISAALGSIDNTEYRKTIEMLISSHRKTIRAKNLYDMKAKLMRYGLSKGFESSLIYEILGE